MRQKQFIGLLVLTVNALMHTNKIIPNVTMNVHAQCVQRHYESYLFLINFLLESLMQNDFEIAPSEKCK